MKKKIFVISSSILGLILFVGVLKLVGLNTLWSFFQRIQPRFLGLYILVSIMIFVGYTYRWQRILHSHDQKIDFFRLFMYKTAGYGVSYLTPSAKLGGEPLRAYLLCKHKIPFKDSFSSVVLDKAVELTANGLFTIVGVLYILLYLAIPESARTILYFVIAFWIVFMMVFYVRSLNGRGLINPLINFLGLKRIKAIRKHQDTLLKGEKRIHEFFKHSKKEFFIALSISLLLWIGMLLEFKVLFMVFGFNDVTLVQLFLVTMVVGTSYIIPVPAAIGVLEGGQEALFRFIQKTTGIGFLIGLITRTRDCLWTLVGITYLYIRGFNFLKEDYKKNGLT